MVEKILMRHLTELLFILKQVAGVTIVILNLLLKIFLFSL